MKTLEVQTDCKQSISIGKLRTLKRYTGKLFRAATRHNHKNSDIKKVVECKLIAIPDDWKDMSNIHLKQTKYSQVKF